MITFGIKTAAKGAVSEAGPVAAQEKINISGDVNNIGLSWGFGLGGEYIVQNNTAVVLGLYFQNGFTDVTGNSGSTLFDKSTGAVVAKPEKSKGTIKSLTIRCGVMF